MKDYPYSGKKWKIVGHNDPAVDPCLQRCGQGTAIIEYPDGKRATSGICLSERCNHLMHAAVFGSTLN